MDRTLNLYIQGTWRDSALDLELRGQAGVYCIRHVPTDSIFVGGTHDMAQAYYSWYQRLRRINVEPALNPAFRAVYTKREDFTFIIKRMEPSDGSNHHRFKTAATTAAAAFKRAHRDRCLNLGDGANGKATTLERAYWRDRTLETNLPNTDIAFRPKYVLQDEGREARTVKQARFPKIGDTRARKPKEGMCMDGCGTRADLTDGHNPEYYMVTDDLWCQAMKKPKNTRPLPAGLLCRSCLALRLGDRPLYREDFPDVPVNNGAFGFDRSVYPSRSLTPEGIEDGTC